MTQSTRPEGYYWVKRLYNSEWSLSIETKSRGVWMYIYPHTTIEDGAPFEIGHRIPSNEELGKMQEAIAELADSLKSMIGIAENASGLLSAEELDIFTAKKLLYKYDSLSNPTP